MSPMCRCIFSAQNITRREAAKIDIIAGMHLANEARRFSLMWQIVAVNTIRESAVAAVCWLRNNRSVNRPRVRPLPSAPTKHSRIISMTGFIHTNKDALHTWLADFLSSNIAISGRRRRVIARSDHQSEKQVHGDAQSHRESVRRDNESETGIRLAHLN